MCGGVKFLARKISAAVIAAVALTAVSMAPSAAEAAQAFGTPVRQNGFNGGPFAIDDNVSVTSLTGITITALGIYDGSRTINNDGSVNNGDGLGESHFVNLYNLANTSTPLARLLIPAGTAATASDSFRFVTLDTPIFVASGTNLGIVGYNLSDGTAVQDPYGDDSTFMSNGGALSFLSSQFNQSNQTTGFPTANDGGGNPFGTGNFQFVVGDATAAVPEPASLTLLGTGSLVLLARRRRLGSGTLAS